MKLKLYSTPIFAMLFSISFVHAQSPAASANTNLSNLKNTKINTSLLPDTTNIRSLGNASTGWKNIYFTGSLFNKGKRTLYADTTGNFFAGINAGPLSATAVWNTIVGNNAFTANTTGQANTALGFASLQSNTTGNQNTSLGFGALEQNVYGANNTAVGAGALTSSFADNNTAIGNYALELNTYGYQNTALGAYAMQYNVGGYANTAFGYYALLNNTSGQYNVAIGHSSGLHNTTGNYNVTIGYSSGYTGTTNQYDNTVAIGFSSANGYVTTGNSVTIGNASTNVIGGQVGWSQYSDGRLKDNIKQNVPGLAFINKLNPVTYHFNIHRQNQMLSKNAPDTLNWRGKYDIEKKQMTGFVAQEVEKAANELGYDFSGVVKPASPDGLYSLTYSEFVVPLVKAVQELSKMNDEKDAAIKNLQQQIDEIKNAIKSSSLAQNNQTTNESQLSQNIPNPVKSSTTIHYTLPQKYAVAQLIITAQNGKNVQQYTLNAAGNGSVIVNAASLPTGVYTYSLYINNTLTASKQMIVAH